MSIALLLVLPTNKVCFRYRIKAKTSDYLRRQFSMFPTRSWKEDYEPQVLGHLQSLIRTAQTVGATVFENACLADLSLATKDHDTVVLLSHWKGPEAVRDDLPDNDFLVRNLVKYLERVWDANAASTLWLRRRFVKLMHGLDKKTPRTVRENTQVAGDILKIMNEFIETQNVLREKIGGDGLDVKATKFTLRTWNRDELDRLFEGLLLPGNRVEFSDGLYAKESVETAIDKAFSGILDLTTCTSTVLSDYLGRVSRGAYLTVQFDKPQDPPRACLFLEGTFQLFGEGIVYGEARKQAKRDFEEVVQALAAEQQPESLFECFFLSLGGKNEQASFNFKRRV